MRLIGLPKTLVYIYTSVCVCVCIDVHALLTVATHSRNANYIPPYKCVRFRSASYRPATILITDVSVCVCGSALLDLERPCQGQKGLSRSRRKEVRQTKAARGCFRNHVIRYDVKSRWAEFF